MIYENEEIAKIKARMKEGLHIVNDSKPLNYISERGNVIQLRPVPTYIPKAYRSKNNNNNN